MSKEVCIVVQARTGSSRLPGKVLMPWVDSIPMLEILLRRLIKCTKNHDLVVATTTKDTDNPIVELAKNYCRVHRGDENDVLTRFVGAITKVENKNGVDYAVPRCETVVRITADCPFTDSQMVDKMIEFFYNDLGIEYLSNCQPKRTVAKGFDVEVFSVRALLKAHMECTVDREHVTPYLYTSNLFPKDIYPSEIKFNKAKNYSIDTQEDYDTNKNLFNLLYKLDENFTYEDVMEQETYQETYLASLKEEDL